MAALAGELGFTFPYLFDETQETAKAYHAACTPDFFLFDGERRLFCRGQMDSARPGNEPEYFGGWQPLPAARRRACFRKAPGVTVPPRGGTVCAGCT